MLAKTVGLVRYLFIVRLPKIVSFIMALGLSILEGGHVALTKDRRLIDIVIVMLCGIEILS